MISRIPIWKYRSWKLKSNIWFMTSMAWLERLEEHLDFFLEFHLLLVSLSCFPNCMTWLLQDMKVIIQRWIPYWYHQVIEPWSDVCFKALEVHVHCQHYFDFGMRLLLDVFHQREHIDFEYCVVWQIFRFENNHLLQNYSSVGISLQFNTIEFILAINVFPVFNCCISFF